MQNKTVLNVARKQSRSTWLLGEVTQIANQIPSTEYASLLDGVDGVSSDSFAQLLSGLAEDLHSSPKGKRTSRS